MTPRNSDRLIEAFLEEGPAVMPDRMLGAIRDEIDHTQQRAGFGPWRDYPMIRAILATAAVVAVIVAGFAVYSVFQGPNVGPPVETPSPQPFPSVGPLSVGTTYVHDEFGEPVRFTVPTSMAESEVEGDYADARNFRVDALSYGVVTFHDDVNVVDDLCNPSSLISLPASTSDLQTWLTDAAGLTVSAPTELLTADGRTALVFDIAIGDACFEGSEPPVSGSAFWFQRNEHHRIYAIPTGADTIVGVTWGGGFAGEGEEFLDTMNAATNDLVRSMSFE